MHSEHGRQRRGGDRVAAGELGTRRDQPSVAQVDAEHQWRSRRGGARDAAVIGPERLGADDVARHAGARQIRRALGGSGARVDPQLRDRRQGRESCHVHRLAGERVQIGDVQASGLADGA